LEILSVVVVFRLRLGKLVEDQLLELVV